MIKVLKDNIVNMDVDAVVNAANTELMGGGGVDGCINLLNSCLYTRLNCFISVSLCLSN